MGSEASDILRAFTTAADLIDPPNKMKWEPLPHFRVPPLPWFLWLLFGGRGSGKTAHAAKYVHDHVHGPPCLPHVPGGHWISVVGPTLGDAVTSCVEGPSGLRLWDPGIRVLNRPGGLIARWSNGTEAKLFGAHSPEDVERFRAGGNRCLVWAEEMAAWRYLEECWQQIRYGLRVGPRPHAIASTTPRTRKLIKELIKDPKVAVQHGTTDQNPHLNQEVKEQLYKDYGGTRMGRQELLGQLLEDIEGALWTGDMIEDWRIKTMSEIKRDMDRIVVGVDPAASEGGDDTGIIVCSMQHYLEYEEFKHLHPEKSHGFVLEDRSIQGKPSKWGKAVVGAYREWQADLVICEKNNGGDMIASVIQSIDNRVPVKLIHASRGKAKRAEPVSNLYTEGRVHHVGMFEKLEDQMTTWNASDPDPAWSPDHMDANVWALTELLLGYMMQSAHKPQDRRLKGRR